jgi:HSP20 family protein
MDDLWDSVFGSRRQRRTAGVFPALNIYEDEEALEVTAEIPGMGPEDLEIEVEDNNLILRGERKIPQESDRVSYHRRERESGTFHRILALPVAVDPGKVKAACRNGVLEVLLPKAPEARPTKIQITSA